MIILRKSVAGLSQIMLERFLARAARAARLRGSVNVLVTSSGEVRTLNRRFLGKDKATDVLSFPSVSGLPVQIAGDIAISADIATQNGKRLGHAPKDEVKILLLHGVLHLAGYDHERDNGRMAHTEMRLRKALKLPLGLIERARGKSFKQAMSKEPGRIVRQKSERRRSPRARGTTS